MVIKTFIVKRTGQKRNYWFDNQCQEAYTAELTLQEVKIKILRHQKYQSTWNRQLTRRTRASSANLETSGDDGGV